MIGEKMGVTEDMLRYAACIINIARADEEIWVVKEGTTNRSTSK